MATTVQQLSDAWNALRNAALGRGTDLPKGMNSELADEVGLAYEQWRVWLADRGALSEAQGEVTLAGEASDWADRYERLAKEVTRLTGKKLPATPSSPVERVVSQAAGALVPWAALVLVGAGVGLVFQLARGIRRGART